MPDSDSDSDSDSFFKTNGGQALMQLKMLVISLVHADSGSKRETVSP